MLFLRNRTERQYQVYCAVGDRGGRDGLARDC